MYLRRLYVLDIERRREGAAGKSSIRKRYSWTIKGSSDIEMRQNILHSIIEMYPEIVTSDSQVLLYFNAVGDTKVEEGWLDGWYVGEISGIYDREDNFCEKSLMFTTSKCIEGTGEEPSEEEIEEMVRITRHDRNVELIFGKEESGYDPVTLGALRTFEYEMVQSEFVIRRYVRNKYGYKDADKHSADHMTDIKKIYGEKYPEPEHSAFLHKIQEEKEWLRLMYEAIKFEIQTNGEEEVKHIMGEQDWNFYDSIDKEINGEMVF